MKNKIITFIFVAYIFLFSIFGIVLKDKDISISERRKLTTFPEFSLSSEYIEKVEKYFLDHFPLRDNLRGIKAFYNYNILQKLDNNGIYLKDNYIFKSEYPTNKDSIQNLYNKINIIKENFTNKNNVHLMIVPDKNYYLNDKDFLQIDYDYIYEELYKIDAEIIELRNILELSDYYETDTHWKQEKILKVIKSMSKVMDFEYIDYNFKKNVYDDFYGVYYGESAINRKPERLTYLTHDYMNNLKVKYLENDKLTEVYNIEKLNGFDTYEVFLDGANSFIEINNSNCHENRELVIFRDSFGSSLTPLLIPYYKKITVIDNRYIDSKNFNKLIKFKDQDILFMFSTLIANNSLSLKG